MLFAPSVSRGAKDIPEHTGWQISLLRQQKGEGNTIKIGTTCLDL